MDKLDEQAWVYRAQLIVQNILPRADKRFNSLPERMTRHAGFARTYVQTIVWWGLVVGGGKCMACGNEASSGGVW